MIGAFVFEIGTFPQKTLKEFYESPNSLWGTPWFKFTLMIGISLILITPLNLLKDITKLRFTSIFGIFCLFLVAIVIIAELPMYIRNYKEDVKINWVDVTVSFDKNLYFFKGTATLFYAYNCHMGLFPIYEKMVEPTKKRIDKVLQRSLMLDAGFYIIVGITGYLTQPIDTPSFIMERDKIGNDIIMTIGRILIVFLITCKIPANYNAARISIFELCFGTREIDNKK